MRLHVSFILFVFGMIQAGSNNTPVAIIGGGFAGLAAAAELEKNGIEYVLFEATNRLGGRVYPIQDKSNNTIQLGAEYINGDDNEIYRIAKKLDVLDEKYSDYWMFQSNVSYGIGGGKFSEEDLQTWKEFAEPLEEEFESAGLKFPRLSAAEFFEKKYKAFLEKIKKNRSTFDALAKLYRSYYETEWSSPMDELALDNFQEWDDKSNDSTSWFLDGEGFKAILDHLKNNVTLSNVKFNSKVSNLNWTEGYVTTTLNGKEDALKFNHAIVTVPLGFLKNNSNLFTPKLPKVKRDAIKYIGFGSLVKVFLEYDKRWWKPSDDVLMTASLDENDSEEKNITDYMRIFQVHEKNRLLLWLDGEGPKIAAKLSNEELADIITRHLRIQFNNTDIPNPKAIYTHNWTADELTRGAYSYITPDSYENLNDSFLDMAEPVVKDNRPLLCFAGEHTHQTMYQTTVGAYESGIREAQRLVKYIKKE